MVTKDVLSIVAMSFFLSGSDSGKGGNEYLPIIYNSGVSGHVGRGMLLFPLLNCVKSKPRDILDWITSFSLGYPKIAFVYFSNV